MYFILICIFLILFSWLAIHALKSTTKGIKLLFYLGGITALVISGLIIISEHYKEINPPALILVLLIAAVLMLSYTIRRLR